MEGQFLLLWNTIVLCSMILIEVFEVAGEVTITANDVTKNNTDHFSQAIIVNGIGNDEVNEALYEWNPSTRTPGFDFYFKSTHSIAATILLSTLNWNANRTFEERKDASGQVLCTAALNGNPVTSKMFTVSIQWKPGSSSLELEHAGDQIIRDNSLTLKCTCQNKGNPPGNVVWVVNGDIRQGGRYINSTIVIDKVSTADNGEYQCYYQNVEVGIGIESETKPVYVKWQPGKATLALTGGDDLRVKQGQRITLTCSGDEGNPMQSVLWMFNSLITETTTIAKRVFTVGPEHNGTWSCRFTNQFGNGTESEGVLITVLLTPLAPIIELISSTAISLTTSFELSPDTNTDSYNHTNITLIGNGESINGIHPWNISEYTFDNLQPSTSYNVSVFYNNDVGEGEPALETFTTKNSPLQTPPSITRQLLDIHVVIHLENPESANEIQISVCENVETNSANCNTDIIMEIEEGEFRKVLDGSFSNRVVNVSVYDNGVEVYTYREKIGPASLVIALILLAGVILVVAIIVIIAIVIKKKDNKKNKSGNDAEEEIQPYTYTNPTMGTNNESRTGTGHAKEGNAPQVNSEVNKGKQLAPLKATPADGAVYSQVDLSKKIGRMSLKDSPMSKKAIDKIMFAKKDGSINIQFEVRKKFTGDIEIGVCRDGDESSKSKVSKQHVGGTKNVVMVLPIKETSQDRYTINMRFISKGQKVQEVDLTYPYETDLVNVTVLNDAYDTSGTGITHSEMPEYSEVNKSKKIKGSEMPIYSEVNKPKKKKKVVEEQPYEDVENKNQSSHNDRSTNAVSPSNAEVAVEGVPHHPPRKGTTKEGVMYAELDLNSSGAPRLLPRLGSKSPAHEPVVYADVRPG